MIIISVAITGGNYLMLNNYYPWALNFDCTFESDPVVDDAFLNKIASVPRDVSPILWRFEWLDIEDMLQFVYKIKTQVKRQVTWLLCEHYSADERNRLIEIDSRVEFIDFNLLVLHMELDLYKSSTLNTKWNSGTNKFLFLTGKPDRLNRVVLLHKFYEHNLLDQCVWSFFPGGSTNTRHLLPTLDDRSFDDFVRRVANNPDNVSLIYQSGGDSCHYDGYPFDATLYSKTSFRVIAETMMFSRPIITEKTWITMANRQPFMVAGYKENLLWLKCNGYRTFENYLPICDYDSITDDQERLDAVVENTKYWLKNLVRHAINIRRDIEHNYQLLRNNLDRIKNQFDTLYQKLNTTDFEIFRIIPLPMQRSHWLNFYYAVKAPSWPDCYSEQDFARLPDWIQREMSEIHGYKSK